MSKAKKRRWRKAEAERRASGIDLKEEMTVAENVVEEESSTTFVEEKSSDLRPDNWDTMSKAQKRRWRKNRLEKQMEEKQMEENTIDVDTNRAPRPAPKLLKVKNHPMYKKFWRLSRDSSQNDEELKQRMRDANLDADLYGMWEMKISARGHGRTGKSAARKRRERMKRAKLKRELEMRGKTPSKQKKKKKKEGAGNEEEQKQNKGKEESKKKSNLFVVNEKKTVYVSGLPHHVGVRKVKQYFKYCGAVAFVYMPTFEDTGKSRGIAQVTFTRNASAQRAMELNGEYWGQRYLEITPYDGSQWKPSTVKPEGCKTVYVGNLAYEMTDEIVESVFSDCGKIESIRWGTEKNTEEFRGFGHVSFEDTKSVDKAVQLAGSICLGRPLKVDYAEERGSE